MIADVIWMHHPAIIFGGPRAALIKYIDYAKCINKSLLIMFSFSVSVSVSLQRIDAIEFIEKFHALDTKLLPKSKRTIDIVAEIDAMHWNEHINRCFPQSDNNSKRNALIQMLIASQLIGSRCNDHWIRIQHHKLSAYWAFVYRFSVLIGGSGGSFSDRNFCFRLPQSQCVS